MNEIAENESKDQEQNAGARRSNVNLEVKYVSLHLQGPEGWRAAVRQTLVVAGLVALGTLGGKQF